MLNFIKNHKILFSVIVIVLLIMLLSGKDKEPERSVSDQGADTWQRHPASPIIVPGFQNKPGGDIVLNAADPHALWDEEERKWKMWFGVGWFKGKDKYIGIKYAESADGINWNVDADLAMEPASDPAAWDATMTETPTVVKNTTAPPERRYLLVYAGGNLRQGEIIPGLPYYQLGVAFSRDGKKFTRPAPSESPYGKAGLALTAADAFPGASGIAKGVLTDPSVLFQDGVYRAWFPGVAMNASGQPLASGIGYITSHDGMRWKASRQNPLSSLARPENPAGPARPTVIWNPTKKLFEMWYDDDTEQELKKFSDYEFALNGYWYASSKDGENWANTYQRGRDFKWDPSFDFEKHGTIAGPAVVLKDGTYHLFYGAYGTKNIPKGFGKVVWALNLATRKAD